MTQARAVSVPASKKHNFQALFLDNTLTKYDKWIAEGKITNTAKVIPVAQSLEVKHWVVPTEQEMHYLRRSRSFALADCTCRTLGGHCDHPRDVCLYLNEASDQYVEKGKARRITLEEAEERVRAANQAGLVPMTIFNPEQHVLALCHCCPCCCHDLQFMLARGRRELVVRSEYVAVQDEDACSACGLCQERCHFDARTLSDGELVYEPDACYGCGLCVSICPSEAISMELRRELSGQEAAA